MDTLLITVAIGENYQKRYKALFYDNHKTYATKCGYDFKIVTDFLDINNQYASFISLQKSLVCSQDFSQKYKKIIYVDADILFNIKTATPIHLLVENENIYIADEYSQPTQDVRLEIQQLNNWERSATDYYALAGLNLKTKSVLNTGLMIFNPEIHRKILEDIYIEAVRKGFNHSRGFHFEQAMIGYGLQKNNCWEKLSNDWNAIWMLQKLAPNNSINLLDFYAQNKAIHFAGNCDVHLIPWLLRKYYGND
jgi:lipopolysaccharide biosynthesis glycosyltransferase